LGHQLVLDCPLAVTAPCEKGHLPLAFCLFSIFKLLF
jgi:hypothetical protein